MITPEVLKKLLSNEKVEFVNETGAVQGVQFWAGDVVCTETSPDNTQQSIMTAPGLLRAMRDAEWRLPAEKRDWAGALEWLKEGREVKRESVQGPYVRLGYPDQREPKGKLLMWAMRVEDFEAKDWVVAR